MTDSTLRVAIQGLYGAIVFGALLFGGLNHNNAAAVLSALFGVLAVILSQSFAIAGNAAIPAGSTQPVPHDAATAYRSARALWWASIVLGGLSALMLIIRG